MPCNSEDTGMRTLAIVVTRHVSAPTTAGHIIAGGAPIGRCLGELISRSVACDSVVGQGPVGGDVVVSCEDPPSEVMARYLGGAVVVAISVPATPLHAARRAIVAACLCLEDRSASSPT